jgi:hypothetical protein
MEIPCTADSDDDESELEELNTVESVRELKCLITYCRNLFQ